MVQRQQVPLRTMDTETLSKFLVVGKPDISEQEIEAVSRVLRSGWIGNGEVSRNFEDEFSKFLMVDSGNAIAVNSCTTGLVLSLKAFGIKKGDEVITSPLTFAATVNAILLVGAKPVFVDVDYTGCIDFNLIEDAITPKTKAIIPVHLEGAPCNMTQIVDIAEKNNLAVIEDAAHAFGGTHVGKHLGTIGDCGVFSFYPTKNLASCDGGMVISKHKEVSEKIRLMASQGLTASAWDRYGNSKVKDYFVEVQGMKGLMNDVTAAIALTQLRRWPKLKEKRDAVWDLYESVYGPKIAGHSHHLYTIRVRNRKELREELYSRGVGTGIHYNSLHLEPAYSEFVKKNQKFPMAEKIGSHTLTLPLSPTMTMDDGEYVIKSVKESFSSIKSREIIK